VDVGGIRKSWSVRDWLGEGDFSPEKLGRQEEEGDTGLQFDYSSVTSGTRESL